MADAHEGPSLNRLKAVRAIVWAGLSAGILDITSAFVIWGLRGVSPVRILQSVASGLLGARARGGGLGTAALGAVLHFVIAFGAAAVYFTASRKLRFMLRHSVVSGVLYGVLVWLFMNLIVLPLSAFPGASFSVGGVVTGLIVHMLFVGLPISLAVRWHSN